MKQLVLGVILLIGIAIGAYFLLSPSPEILEQDQTPPIQNTPTTQNNENENTNASTSTDETSQNDGETLIGSSVEERPIIAYHYGEGETEILFIGGIHGGYSWNTTLVAYELMEYLEENEENIPENLRVTVVPVLNPDGLNKVLGTTERFSPSSVPSDETTRITGRFNAQNVDLNRNFDCDWQSSGTWQNRTVSGGSKAFSEPESQALRDYVIEQKPKAVVAWYSAAGGVFSSNCHNGILPETKALTDEFAKASGYKAYENFDFYSITGDMVNWLAKNGTPAISVLLTNHQDIEWSKNKAGVEAILEYYAE